MANLISTMAAVSGCKSIKMEYIADCGFPKKSGLNGIIKFVRLDAQFNYSYEDEVNERLEQIGAAPTFVAQGLPFGTWYEPNKIVVHNGKYYLRFYTHKSTRPEVSYFEADGTPCSPSRVQAIKDYLASKPKPISKTQADAGLTDNQVEPRVVSMDNIVSITFDGQTLTQDTTLRIAV